MSNSIGPLQGQLTATEIRTQQSANKAKEVERKLKAAVGDEKRLKKACEDFEAVFMSKIWQQMRKTVPKEGYLHNKQEEYYLSMFDHELSRKMSQAGGIGLGDMLYRQLKSQLTNAARATAGEAVVNTRLDHKDVNTALRQDAVGRIKTPQAPEKPAEPALEVQTFAEPAQQAAPGAAPRSGDIKTRIDDLAREIMDNQGLQSNNRAVDKTIPLSAITWPLQGEVVASFGNATPSGRAGILGMGPASNTSVQIKAAPGDAVKACLPGVVTFAGQRGGRHVVEMAHNGGLTSHYTLHGASAVQAGQHVNAGHEIAHFPPNKGQTEVSAAMRLAFEIRHGGVALNPELLNAV